jgi:hypothetical protein
MKLVKKFAAAAVLGTALVTGSAVATPQPARADDAETLGAVMGILGAVQDVQMRSQMDHCMREAIRSGEAGAVAQEIVRGNPAIVPYVNSPGEWQRFQAHVAYRLCRAEYGFDGGPIYIGQRPVYVPVYIIDRHRHTPHYRPHYQPPHQPRQYQPPRHQPPHFQPPYRHHQVAPQPPRHQPPRHEQPHHQPPQHHHH